MSPSEPRRVTAGYMVRIVLPPGMSPEQGQVELRHSISFGRAEVSFMYVLEDPPDEQDT